LKITKHKRTLAL